jgi:hypothetical protein
MSDPPPHQRAAASERDNPTAEQIKRVATAFEAYTSQNETAQAKTSKHNRKVRWWTRFASIVALAYSVITATILLATILSIHETRRATRAANRAAAAATSRVLKKAVDRRFGAIPRLTHVRNPLILREPNSDAEPVAWRFYPNRAFFSTLLDKPKSPMTRSADNFGPTSRFIK